MISNNLWVGRVVRLTGLERQDAKTFSTWHNDAGFLRLSDAEAARPRTENEILRELEDWQKDPKVAAFAVRLLDSEELLAVIMLDDIREGVFREFLQRDGRRYDMYLYGLLRREWEALSQEGARVG